MKNTLQEYLHRFQKEHKRGCRYASVVGVLALITVLVVNWQLHGTGVALSGDTEYVCGKEEHEHSLKEGCYEVNDADLICGFTEGQIIDPEAAAAADAAAGKSAATSEEKAKADSSQANTSAGQNNSAAAQNTTDQSSNTSGDSSQSSTDNAAHNAEINKQIAELEAQEIPTEKEHYHTDACYEEKQVETEAAKTEKELTCGKSEHTHSDDCYSVQESAAEGEEGGENSEAGSAEKTLTCGQEEHSHTDSCYTEKTTEAQTTTEKTLICGLEEGQKVAMTEEEIQKAKDEKAKKIEELKAQLVEETTTAQTSENNNSTTSSESNNAANNAAENSASANTENGASADTTVNNDSSAAANTSASAEGNTAASDQTTGTTDSTNTGTTENAGTGSNTAATTETTANTDNNANAAGTTGTADSTSASTSGTSVADSTNASTTGTSVTDSTDASTTGTTVTDNTNASTSGTTAKTENASADTTNDGRHHHTIDCYKTYKLICQKEEHKHTSACLIDKNADVETAADWEKTIPSLTGDKAADLISVGRSQLGYTESTRNYDEESHRGYTRYGAWYGNPYGDWGTMFTAFCLHYANITDVPTNSGVQAWIADVKSADMWWDASEYSSGVKAGDLIFFNDSNDHMGIVSSISDTSVTVIEGNRPNGDGSDSVQENTYSTTDGSIAGYCELPTGDNHDNEINVMDSAFGADLTKYIDNAKLQKMENGVWKDATEFTTKDSVRAKFEFKDFPVDTLKKNNNKCFVPLSENIDCSAFASETYKLVDETIEGDDKTAGTYTFQKDSSGKWNIVLDINESYVNKAGENVHGAVNFQFNWNIKDIPDAGKTEIVQIGKWSGSITIKNSETTGAAFEIGKDASAVSLDDKGYAVINYTVTLKVNGEKGYQGPINISEVLEGKGFEFAKDTVKITGADGSTANVNINVQSAATTDAGATAEFQITSNAADKMVPAGQYKITYQVKTSQPFGNAEISSQVHNKVTVKDKEKPYTAEKWTTTTTSGINKSGQVVTEDGNIYINYRVTINKGAIVANLKEETKFSDTIPDDLELVEDSVTITQYGPTGIKTDTEIKSNYDADKKELTSTLPAGQYYYTIEYKTKVKDVSKLPVAGKEITNTAHSEGGVKGDATDKHTVKNDDVLTKELVSDTLKTDSGNNVVILKWKSVIKTDIAANDVYMDWGNTQWNSHLSKHVATMCMTEAQMQAIKLYDKNNQEISKDSYEITDYNDKKDQGEVVGLFQITFKKAITGPVTIEYETTGDLKDFQIGDSVHYENHCEFNTHHKWAGKTVDYVLEDHSVIWKTSSKDTPYYDDGKDSSSVTLKPGEDTLTWCITVNKDNKLNNTELVITDRIAGGMSFVEGSVSVKRGGWESLTEGKDYSYSYQNGLLTVNIGKDTNTGRIDIWYKTKLPDDFLHGNTDVTKSFTNTAEVTYGGSKGSSSYTQTVTRTVAQKTGAYDSNLHLLTYQIALNPDGITLNNGNKMKVTDSMNGLLVQYTKLNSLAAYEAVPVKDSSGNVTSYTAGRLIQEMTPDAAEPTEVYHYYYSNGRFVAWIPDSQSCILVARYTVDAEIAGDGSTITNDVTLTGQSEWKADQHQQKLEKDSGGWITTDGNTLTVWKRDAGQYNITLSGATFELKEYDATTKGWIDPDNTAVTFTTGNDGRGTAKIKKETLYKLTETAAPTGYLCDSTPRYFVAYAEGDTKLSLPDNISADDNYSQATVEWKLLSGTDTNRGTVYIDFNDEKDSTTVEKGQLKVSKIWKDSNGNTLLKPTDLTDMPAITVTLTKHTPEMAKITITGNNSGTCVIEVPKHQNSKVELTGANTQCSEGGTASIIDGKKTLITNITGDVQITVNANVGSDYAEKYVTKTVADAKDISRTKTTTETATLNSSNNWSYQWENLEKEDYITYTLTETTVDGYTATYQLNGSELNDGTEFSLGANGDVINITNTPNSKLYVLPKTGGSGVMPIYVTGGLLTAGAAGLWVTGKRRKREQ